MIAVDLAKRLDLVRYRRSWRGRCPACDYPGTFSLKAGRDGRALLFCASCQDREALADAAAQVMGQPRHPAAAVAGDKVAASQRKQEAALRLWRGSEPVAGTPAERYLTARAIPNLTASPALRFRVDTPHPEGGRNPALLALVSDASGAPLAIHRTFIMRDGRKAATEPAKASLGPIWGGAIRLHAIEPEKPLVIGEGVESSASAGRLMGVPAWAATAGNLAKGLVLPPGARRVVIAADPDKPGRDAARDAWLRWRAEGREVRIATPDGDGDFNDLLRAREVGHAG